MQWRKSTKTDDGIVGFHAEAETSARARAELLPMAQNLEEPNQESFDAVRESLTHWLEWRLKEAVAELEARASGLANDLAGVAMSGRALRWLQKHLGNSNDGLHESIGTGAVQYSAVGQARAFVNNTSRPAMVAGLVGLIVALAAACVFDFQLVNYIVMSAAGSVVDGDIPDAMVWPLMALSVVTIAGYTLAGVAWHWRKTRGLAVLVYAVVFGVLAVQVWPTLDETVSMDWRYGLLGLWTTLYTLAGILLMIVEQVLAWTVGMLCDHAHAVKVTRKEDAYGRATGLLTTARQQAQDGQFVPRTVTSALRQANTAMKQAYTAWANQGTAIANDLAKQPEVRERGQEQVAKAKHCLDKLKGLFVLALMLSGLVMGGCRDGVKPERDKKAERPPVPMLVIAVDGSDGSPVKNAAWVQGTFPYIIDEEIKKLPLGSFVGVIRCGDNTQTEGRGGVMRVQKRTTAAGKTRAGALAWVREQVLAFSEVTRRAPYKRSELTGCMADSARLLEPVPGNRVIFLTDGAEWTPGGINCETPGKPCKLPAPLVGFQPGTVVNVIGCGAGYPAAHAQHLQREWARFLEQAGVDKRRILIQG